MLMGRTKRELRSCQMQKSQSYLMKSFLPQSCLEDHILRQDSALYAGHCSYADCAAIKRFVSAFLFGEALLVQEAVFIMSVSK